MDIIEQLNFPWPSSRLSPNARLSWQGKIKSKREARELAGWTAKVTRNGESLQGHILQMKLIFSPSNKRRRDLDNLLSSMKPTIDGVFAELGTDDSQIKRIILEWGPVVKGGAVTMILEVID